MKANLFNSLMRRMTQKIARVMEFQVFLKLQAKMKHECIEKKYTASKKILKST